VNNLEDVTVEIPKRLINETYSAFAQGFMPTLARHLAAYVRT